MQQSYRFFLLSLLTLLLATPVMGLSEVPVLDGDAREILADLPALKGTQAIDIAALQNKPLLVTFFASWCPPCREEFSHLNRLQELYQDTDLTIVAINVFEAWDDNDESRMDSFLEFTQPNFPTLAGSEHVRILFGGIDRIPTVYGFNQQGNLVYRFIHRRGAKKTNASFNELRNAANRLLQSE